MTGKVRQIRLGRSVQVNSSRGSDDSSKSSDHSLAHGIDVVPGLIVQTMALFDIAVAKMFGMKSLSILKYGITK